MRGILTFLFCLALTLVAADTEPVTFQIDIVTDGDLTGDDAAPLTCAAFVDDVKSGFFFAFNEVISDLEQELADLEEQFQKLEPVDVHTFVTCKDAPEGSTLPWMRIRGTSTGTLDAPKIRVAKMDALNWLRDNGVERWLQKAKERIGTPNPWDAESFQYIKKKYQAVCMPGFTQPKLRLKPDGTRVKILVGCPPEDLAWDPDTQAAQVFITS